MSNHYYIGIDLGGTRIKCGVVRDGQVLAAQVIAAESDRGLASASPRLEATVRAMAGDLGVELSACRGLALGFPALVDFSARRIWNSYGKFTDAPGIDLAGWCRERLGLPIAIENDARLALIGEWQHGAASGHPRCAMITLGTGIGTAVILNGQPLRGRLGVAGNLGSHLLAISNGRTCSCGRAGCFESESGGWPLGAIARQCAGFDQSPLRSVDTIDYAAIYTYADADDPCATAVRDRCERLWAELCFHLMNLFEPGCIVVGGGVMRRSERIPPVLQRYVDRHAALAGLAPRIVAAQNQDHMALLSAPYVVEEQLASPPA